jgi:hypothetical protein
MQAGRKTLYKKEFNNMAYKLCLLGYTDEDLAEFFEVTKQTINNWKHEHEEFFYSLIRGKSEADAEVANALYNRAIGLIIKEDAITRDGNIVTLNKQLPPDASAAKHWLSNRQPKYWRKDNEHNLNITNVEPLVIIRTEDSNNENNI